MARKSSRVSIFSHWYYLVEGLQASPKEFYAAVKKALAQRRIPDSSTTWVDFREGGLLSAKREYLRVRRKEFIFDICGAPFGTGFFFSWWLGELASGFWALVSLVPVFGPLVLRTFRPDTYYKVDTALMFQESVSQAVFDVINQTTAAKGLRPLSELERKPILRQFQA